jgi:hypothetical protein
MLNTGLLKSPTLWVTVVAAILGILLSQGVIVSGSTLAQIAGWVLTLLGSGATGHTIASLNSAAASATPAAK